MGTTDTGMARRVRPAARPSLIKRLRSDRRGATLIEFALVAIPFFMLLFGIFEVGFVYWGTLELENATDDAARMIRTGQAQAGNYDETKLKQEICDRVSLLVGCTSKLRVDVQSAIDISGMTAPALLDGDGNLNNNFSFNLGAGEQVVMLTSFYEWPLMTILTSNSLSNMSSGNRLLRASAAFRNEPFPEN